MQKFSDFGRDKSFELDEAREFINFGTSVSCNSALRHLTRGILIVDGQLSRADLAYIVSIRSSYVCCRCEDSFIMEHYCPHRFSTQFGFHQDILMDIDFSISASYASTSSGIHTLWENSQVLSPS